MSFQVGVGYSHLEDSFIAGVQAVRFAKEGIEQPSLALVFGSIRHNQEQLLAGIASQVDKRIIFGCSSFAEMCNAGVTENSVVVAIIQADDVGIDFLSTTITDSESHAGRTLAELINQGKHCGKGKLRKFPLALIFRGISPLGNVNEGIRIFHDLTESIPLFGGMASNDYNLGSAHPDFWANYQYSAGKVSGQDCGLAVLNFPDLDDYRISFGFAHGWEPIGEKVTITRCDGHRIYELNNVPIIDFFRQFLSQSLSSDREFFLQSVLHRHGLSLDCDHSPESRSVVKIPVKFDHEAGYIEYFPPIDFTGKQVRLIQANRQGVINGCRDAANQCRQALGEYHPAMILVISCCMRASILHSRINHELDAMKEAFGHEVPIIGYYSGGELLPYLNSYEEVSNRDNSMWGTFYQASTIGVMAIGCKNPPEKKPSLPQKSQSVLPPDLEIKRLRGLLSLSETSLDETQNFLTSISRKSYDSGEKLKEQNKVLAQRNDLNSKLQDIVHCYTPHEVWTKAGDSVARGEYELPENEIYRTFLFMDVKGFTSFSENHTSSEVVATLNQIFKPATDFIYSNRGDVDKYIGDCIFAVFADENSAVVCGKQILSLLKSLQGDGLPFSLRIGINSGRAIWGNVGSRQRREYTYIGDAVNVAQRLESNCTAGKMLISEKVYEKAEISFTSAEKRSVSMKGKRSEMIAYECTP